jgi:hypothetical protein
MAQGETCLSAAADAPPPVNPATTGTTKSPTALSSSCDGTLHQAVSSTPADQASAFQRLAKTVVILGPKNMAPA